MELEKIIKGYRLYLINIDKDILNLIKKDLTITVKNDNFNTFYEIYNYREYKNYILLPIHYVNNSQFFKDKTVILKRPKSIDCSFNFKGELKDFQKEAYNCLKTHIQDNNTGIFCLETGYGKTFLSLKLMTELQKKTLIISASVNQTDLLHQWKESIHNFVENPSVGILQGKNIDTDKNIVLTTIKSISQINYDEKIFNGFGLVIIDECFLGNQKIHTSAGLLEIQELYDFFITKIPVKIMSYSEKTKDFEFKSLTYSWKKEYKGLFVKINNEVECTYNHLFLTKEYGWMEAIDLEKGDILINIKGNTVISQLEIYEKDCIVYDIEVDDNHNFVLEQGFVAHNFHHISSKSYSEALFKIGGVKKILAISATPERIDNCDKLLRDWLGPVFYRGNKEKKGLQPIVEVHKVNFDKHYREFKNRRGDISYTEMISNLLNISQRNLYITKLVKKVYCQNRVILCLTDRIENVNLLYNMLKEIIDEKDLAYYIGTKMKKEEKKNALNKKVIIATTKSFSEGIDKQDLNTLILCCPKKHIEENLIKKKNGSSSFIQIIGRIMRKDHLDINPMVIDIFDDFSIYKYQFYSRKKFYEKQNWEIIQYNSNKIEKNNSDVECSSDIKIHELIL